MQSLPSDRVSFQLSITVEKSVIIQRIILQLEAELSRFAKAARVAHTEATDEQSRAENKYDTRGLEASYLARGQSLQWVETEQALDQFVALPVRNFAPDESVGVGALIELESGSERTWYFVGPAAGGTEVICADQQVIVITPQSPIGRLLVGKGVNDPITLDRTVHRVRSVR